MDRTVWFRVAFRFSINIGGTIILESQVPISMYCIWKHCTQQLFSLRESVSCRHYWTIILSAYLFPSTPGLLQLARKATVSFWGNDFLGHDFYPQSTSRVWLVTHSQLLLGVTWYPCHLDSCHLIFRAWHSLGGIDLEDHWNFYLKSLALPGIEPGSPSNPCLVC